MATDIKTVLKMDNSDIDAKLKLINKAVKESFGEWQDAAIGVSNTENKIIELQKELKTASGARVAQIKQEILAQKELKKELQATATARKKDISNLKYFSTQTKSQAKATNEVTVAQNKQAKLTSNLTNSLVRHLRQLETAIVAYYTLTRGFSATIGKGIQVNRMMEDNTMGIAALLSANTRMILSNGELVTSYDKFIMGQTVAKETMEELRKASVKTFATFPQLTEIFQQAIGQTLSMGNAFGSTTDEIIQNTIKLSQRMSNIGGAIGMPMDRIREEIRSLLSGNASTDSLISTMIFGSPGEANKAIRMAKERGKDGLTNMLNEVLKPFDAIEGVRTFSRSMLTLEDAYSNAMRRIVEESGLFDATKEIFYDMASAINENQDTIASLAKNFGMASAEIGRFAKDIGDAILYPLEQLQKMRDDSLLISSGRIAGLSPKEIKQQLDSAKQMLSEAQKDLNTTGAWDRTLEMFGGSNQAQEKSKVAQVQAVVNKLQREYNRLVKTGAVKDEKELVKEKEKNEEKVKSIGKLLTKYSNDLKIIEDLEKKRNRELDKELKIKQSIKDIDEVISKLELAKKNKNTAEEQKVFEDAILRAKREKKSLALDLNELYKERNEKHLKEEERKQRKITRELEKQISIQRKREDFLFSAREKRASLITSEADKEKVLLDIQHERALVSLERQKKDMELTPENYKMALELEQELYEYQKYRLSDVGKLTETTTNALKSGMKDFFDITSDGFGDLGNLANNVLSQIISKMIEVQMVNPFVDAAAPMLSGFIGSLFGGGSSSSSISSVSTLGSFNLLTRANGGEIPTKAYASGGLLTGGSGVRDDLYLGAASGSHVFAMGGEYIVNKNATNSVGKNTMDYINSTGKLPDTSGDNIKVEIINQTSSSIDSAEVFKSTKTNEKGEEEKILSVVLNGVATNKMNARTALKKLVG